VKPKYRAGKRMWSRSEDAAIRRYYPNEAGAVTALRIDRTTPATYARAKKLGVCKSAAFLVSAASGRLIGTDPRGNAGRFNPGHVPANKGLRGRIGWAPGRMADGQFKKGALSGRARQLLKPVNAERISKDGYLERKVYNEIPTGVTREEANRLRQRRWRAVHVLVWEAANGPLPKGCAVAFKNGDKRDIRLDNLELLTRGELMLRNTIHNYPKPIALAVQLLGAVNRKIRRRAREEQDRRSA